LFTIIFFSLLGLILSLSTQFLLSEPAGAEVDFLKLNNTVREEQAQGLYSRACNRILEEAFELPDEDCRTLTVERQELLFNNLPKPLNDKFNELRQQQKEENQESINTLQRRQKEENQESINTLQRQLNKLFNDFRISREDENHESIEDVRRQLYSLNLRKYLSLKEYSEALYSLGDLLRILGDLELSKKILKLSLQIAYLAESESTISAVNLSLGNTTQALAKKAEDLGDPQQANKEASEALELYQQALATVPSTDTDRWLRIQLNRLSLLVRLKQRSNIQTLWPEIESQLERSNPSPVTVYARVHLAQSLTCLKLTELKNQRKYSSPISRRCNILGSRFEETREGLNQTFEWTSISDLLTTAVQLSKTPDYWRTKSTALASLGELYELTQQWNDAQELTKEALGIAQSIQAWDLAYQWQWQLARIHRNQGQIDRALKDYAVAVETLKYIRGDLLSLNPDVQFSFRDNVEPVYREYVDLLLQPDRADKNLEKARDVIASLQLAELENFLQEACTESKPEQIERVTDNQDPKAAVIYPIILEDRIEVILKLSGNNLHHYSFSVSQSEVEKTLQDLQLALQEEYTFKEVKRLSKVVYDWLLGEKVEKDLKGIETLVFFLDTPLRNTPMAALYDGQHYLIENYAVAIAPSLQLSNPQPLPKKRLRVLAAGLTEPPEELRRQFAVLPQVKNELDAIEQTGVSVKRLSDEKFTSAAFRDRINASTFDIVHLATHGEFSSRPLDTFLLAADGKIQVNQLDELFRARSQTRSAPIELLVMSACETASGDKRATLGISGVAVRAGARSAIASLWSLLDESSAEFTKYFYEALVNNPEVKTKAQALQIAQQSLLKDTRYEHPRFWAPYILVGNWL
jgi:CHAT domain-containing protein